jgi:mersacidin/lichenicidin family type 2 lantibiotic
MIDISKAWTDAEYFNSLTAAEKATVPANPAGSIDLSMSDLRTVAGARAAASCTGCYCCYSKTKVRSVGAVATKFGG